MVTVTFVGGPLDGKVEEFPWNPLDMPCRIQVPDCRPGRKSKYVNYTRRGATYQYDYQEKWPPVVEGQL